MKRSFPKNLQVIDLTSSSSKKQAVAAAAAPPQGSAITSLVAAHPTAVSLAAHLDTLPRAELVSTILRTAFPNATPVPSDWAHCFYCHANFRRSRNTGGCKIKHFLDLDEDDDEEAMWDCCGETTSFVDYDPRCHQDPRDTVPYCYSGPHHEERIHRGEMSATNGIKWWFKIEKNDELVGCGDPGCFGKKGSHYYSQNFDVLTDDENKGTTTEEEEEESESEGESENEPEEGE